MNIRARQPFGPAKVIIARTALKIDGLTKDSNGNLLPGVIVHLLRTDNDAIQDRTVSNASAQYSVSPYDTTAHYAVAFLPATADSTLYTADNTYKTADRGGQTDGITVDSLFGI